MNTDTLRQMLSRGVGRRIFILFLVAAAVPMIFTASLSNSKFREEVRAATSRALNDRAKQYGEDILTRITFSAEKALEVSRLIEADISLEAMSDEFLTEGFDGIWVVPGLPAFDANDRQYFGVPSDQIDVDFLGEGNAQLIVTENNNLLLVTMLARDDRREFVLFRLVSDVVWGNRETLTYVGEFCIFSVAGSPLHCTAPIGDALALAFSESTAKQTENAFIEWQNEDSVRYASRRYLFLNAVFRSDPLAVTMVQQKDVAMQSGVDFARLFFPSVVLVLLLVGLLSMSLIGQSLTPLRKLTRMAKSVSDGDFSARARIETNDEFEKLGLAFDHMTQRLGQQVSVLEAMSSIDQMILGGSDLDQISAQVIRYLHGIGGCSAAAVLVPEADAPEMGKLLCSIGGGDIEHERVVLPIEMNQPLSRSDDGRSRLSCVAPEDLSYAAFLVASGHSFVIPVPVLVQDHVKGLLIVGFKESPELSYSEESLCVDLAGRFAVALANLEREEKLYRQAHYDVLTGLPNRQLLKDRLEQNLSRVRDSGEQGAVLFIDLDRFKEVNDEYGHSIGDALLCQAAERISSVMTSADTVARLGGDEFVVVISDQRNDRHVRRIAEKLLQRLDESFSIRGNEHFLGASIGIVLFPSDGATVETLLRNADAAMYRAKDSGRNRFEFFSRTLNAENTRKIKLERDLRTAVANRELEVYFQPQLGLATGEICGAEALVRWQHPTLGDIGPDEFIPLAEDSDLIIDLGSFVLQRSCEHLKALLDQDLHPGVLSINVSGRQLSDGRFERTVLEPMRRLSVNPGFVQLEITETTVAQNRDIATEILSSLREAGIKVALDDFGTGYSSLSYLENMPFDSIKIDKSFIGRLGQSETSDSICKTIITMADQLNKKSIAEGVENRDQLDFLTDNGCDVIQGYYYAKPMVIEQFRDFLAAQSFHTQRRRVLEIAP